MPSGPMTRCALHIHHKTGSCLNSDDLWLAIPGAFRFLSFFLYYLDESTGEGEARPRTLVTYIELLSHCRSIPDLHDCSHYAFIHIPEKVFTGVSKDGTLYNHS